MAKTPTEKKQFYHFDEEKLSFVEEKMTPSRVIKRTLLYLLGGLVVAAGVMALLFFAFDTEETASLKQQQRQLEIYVKKSKQATRELEEQVNQLAMRDQELRTRILGVKEDEIGVVVDTLAEAISDDPASAAEMLAKLEARIKAQESNYGSLLNKFAHNPKMLQHIPGIKPVKGEILAFFGERIHPALKLPQMHPGIDFEARVGSEVYATGDGKITYAGIKRRSHQGNVIQIDHGQGYMSRYAHLSGFEVKQGQKVKRGDLIGYSGTPSNGKGPHLHYEVWLDKEPMDPLDYLYLEYDRAQYLELSRQAQLEGESMD